MNEDLLNIVKIIRAKMNMIILALFVSTSMIAGWSVVQLFIEQPYLEKTDEMLERVARDDLKLLGIVHDIRYDVIQVQQYLTDISATRGLDGLDDGFKQAALYAEDFRKAIAEAHEIADSVNLSEVTGSLNNITEEFDLFYDHGVKMAARYIAEGPAGGNKMMPDFDSRAKTLSGSVLDLFTMIGDNASADLLETEESIDTLKDNNETMILLAIFPALLGVLAAVFGIVAVRRICKVLESDSSR
ncbi:MAG: hypothetical protein H8E36_09565 [Rhodospirillaceae bacterium]|nr:hypothetical protein [Rhodospirillaceae bacterium]MBL6930155.1 hypothetical protein [Rhodospirillales bacterium]MBL6940821.1 hypothetical protein [Rhodospirillales bacterium]